MSNVILFPCAAGGEAHRDLELRNPYWVFKNLREFKTVVVDEGELRFFELDGNRVHVHLPVPKERSIGLYLRARSHFPTNTTSISYAPSA